MDDVLAKCDAISTGEAHCQSCSDVFGNDLAISLRFTRCGKHFVIFIETATEIRIIDYLHQSADFARNLQGPHP